MKKLYKILGIIVIGTVIAIGLAGCENGTTDKGEYHLKWGVTQNVYSGLYSLFTTGGLNATASGSDWVLATDSTAKTAYGTLMRDVTWIDSGDFDGSFEECRDFSLDGVSAPDGLRAAVNTNKAKAPLGGIFVGRLSNTGTVSVLFYITKN